MTILRRKVFASDLAGGEAGGRFQDFQAGQRRRRPQLIAGEAVAVEKCFELVVSAQKGRENLARGQRGGHGQVTAGQPLGQGREIGMHVFLVTGQQARGADGGAAKGGHHFVGNQLGAVAAGDFRHPAQPAGRLRDHAGRALDERLKNKRGVGIALLFPRGEFLLHFSNAFPMAFAVFPGVGPLRLGAVEGAAIAVGGHDLAGFEKQAGVTSVKQINVAEADRPDGVAVIGGVQAEKRAGGGCARRGARIGRPVSAPLPSRSSRRRKRTRAPIGAGRGAAGRKARGAGGGLDELLREPGGGFAGQAEGGGVGDFLELAAQGGVDFGMGVAVEVGPDGGVGVQILAAGGVAQHGAATVNNNNRRAPEPVPHLGEGMPDVAVIQLGEGGLGGFQQDGLEFSTESSAASICATSAGVWAALRVRRRRAWPRATVGKRMAGMKMPCSRNRRAMSIALASSPIMIGMMAAVLLRRSARGVPLRASARWADTAATLAQSRRHRSSPASLCTKRTPAAAAAAAAGTGAVEKTKLRARLIRQSISAREPQM